MKMKIGNSELILIVLALDVAMLTTWLLVFSMHSPLLSKMYILSLRHFVQKLAFPLHLAQLEWQNWMHIPV